MVVNPSVPAKTVPEFIAYAKAHPAKISMASQGIGGSGHLTGQLFQMRAGVNVVHVPYRGAGPALADLLGGQVEFMFAAAASTIEYVITRRVAAGCPRSLARPAVTWIKERARPDVIDWGFLKIRRSSRQCPGSAGPSFSPPCGFPRCLCPVG
jgi:tripartite-type tricarboxylate transporter receptor subunit TctC